MKEKLDFQRFLFNRQELGMANSNDYVEKANEGITNLIKNFDISRPSCAFEFAWNKSSSLARSAVLLMAKQEYPHLFENALINDPSENFTEKQKKILQTVMKNIAADLVGACSVMDCVASHYEGLKWMYEQDKDVLLKNIGPSANVEFIYMQNQDDGPPEYQQYS